ncbi:hypothetical protein STIAU_4175 [Stigmatella aurantiaca DW4/3-1]|uniref:Uncharacterized protein n=1 Tax=Stigmatella aurantiaca (strain DW4/3-1) TaxID=378806 RepID=Q093Z9_STIAD|nr:hypothetical protein STIAU_4175 [Stigmatella aurantiaca DW4/3-1]
MRFCSRSVVTTVRIRSTKRLPSGDCVPKLVFLYMTAWRMVRSPKLLVGSSPSTWTNVHMADSSFRISAAVPAVLSSAHTTASRRSLPTLRSTFGIRSSNSSRGIVPSRTRRHPLNMRSRSFMSSAPRRPPSPPRSMKLWKSLVRWLQHNWRRKVSYQLYALHRSVVRKPVKSSPSRALATSLPRLGEMRKSARCAVTTTHSQARLARPFTLPSNQPVSSAWARSASRMASPTAPPAPPTPWRLGFAVGNGAQADAHSEQVRKRILHLALGEPVLPRQQHDDAGQALSKGVACHLDGKLAIAHRAASATLLAVAPVLCHVRLYRLHLHRLVPERLDSTACQPLLALVALPWRGNVDSAVDLLRWHQLSLVVLVSRLATRAATRSWLRGALCPGWVGRWGLGRVGRVLAQSPSQLSHFSAQGCILREQCRHELLQLGHFPFQLGDAGICGVNRAHPTGSTLPNLPCR